MPINRAPWTALVDDSGQNLDGSIWNKAAIKNVVLDPVDNAFVWTPIAFNAAQFVGFTPGAANVLANRYVLIGKTLWWSLYIDSAPIPVTIGALYVYLPLGLTAATPALLPIFLSVPGVGWALARAGAAAAGATSVQLTQVSYAAFAAGTVAVQMVVQLEVQ
jgi:hypothetical protein